MENRGNKTYKGKGEALNKQNESNNYEKPVKWC